MGSCKDFYKPSPKRLAAVFVFGLMFFAQVAATQGQEPAQKFLDALRERGYYDVAIHYLDGAAQSAMVPEGFRERVVFEKAQILIDSVGSIRNPEEQEKRLNEADELLSQYASSISNPIEATEVKKIQANVRYFRGRNYLKQASLDKTKAARKTELFGLANQLLGDAVPKFREVQNAQRKQIEDFQIDPEDPNSDENLRKLQASFVDTRLKVPVAMEKFALSFGDDQANRKSKLVEAGNEFDAVAKLYDQRFVQGQMAKAFAARCFQQAGDFGKSFELLKEVFDYPTPPKPLVQEGLVVGIETWPKIEPYPAKEVIAAAEQPVMLLSRREKANPMWLRIQLELARAKYAQSVAVKAEDASLSKQLKRDASRMAREVARKRSPHSQMAADMLGEWGVSVEAAGGEAEAITSTATSFDDAKQKAKDLVSTLSGPLADLNKAKRSLARITDAVQKSTEQTKVDEMQSAIDSKADTSLTLLSQAVRFADSETSRADLNNIRYLQAYSHFAKGDYLNAAVIGKFLMEKYPTIEWSQQASGLMVRSYERMFDSASGEKKKWARNNVIKGATSMMDLWPDSADSSAAAVSATRVTVLDSDFDAAKRFFENIPESSSARPSLAARIGQDIWGQRKSAATEDDRAKTTETAKYFLAIASEGVEPASMDFSTAVAALYFVDACRETGDLGQANDRIEGLLDSLDANQAIGKSAKFRQAVYNSSLNVYLDALGSEGDPDKWIAKAQTVIERMGSEAAGDAAAQQNVSRVYRKIASDLKAQFESKPNLNEKQQLAGSLESFFAGIGSVAKDGKTRLWAGSTLLSIAESLKLDGGDAKGKELAAEAIKLLESARKAGFGSDKGLELSYQHQLALAQRCSGNYAEAVKSFEAILEKANGLNFQIDAAKTLFMWGVEQKDAKALTRSMNGQGQYKDPKTKKTRKRIWGWKTMVGLIRNNEKLREQFRECEYYSVLCRLRYGEFNNNAKAINSAKTELEKALKRYPDLIEGNWKSKFDQLMKDLESAKKQMGNK